MLMPMLSYKAFATNSLKYFFVGCMVSRPNRLLQWWTTMSLINKMNGGCFKEGKVEEFGLDRTFFSGAAKSNQN